MKTTIEIDVEKWVFICDALRITRADYKKAKDGTMAEPSDYAKRILRIRLELGLTNSESGCVQGMNPYAQSDEQHQRDLSQKD